VSLNVTDRLHANALSGTTTTGLDIEEASVASPDVWKQTSHPPVVYFLTNGNRAKIGTSTNITARVSALSLRRSNAELLLQGGNDLENALHHHFECDRIAKTEWFVLSPRIQDYIARRKAADAALRQPCLPAESLAASATHTGQTEMMHVTIPQPRTPTAEERILKMLTSSRPDIDDGDITYIDRSHLLATTGLKEGTFANALGKLETAGKIHRIAEGRSVRVGLGPEPQPGQ
jgi:hypothetical protein